MFAMLTHRGEGALPVLLIHLGLVQSLSRLRVRLPRFGGSSNEAGGVELARTCQVGVRVYLILLLEVWRSRGVLPQEVDRTLWGCGFLLNPDPGLRVKDLVAGDRPRGVLDRDREVLVGILPGE